jgi:hypothetical protein
MFDVMLSAYIAGLRAYQQRSKKKGEKEGSKRPSLDGWDRAFQLAELARQQFRQAEDERAKGDIASADVTVKGALIELKTRCSFHLSARLIYHYLLYLSTEAVPNMYKSNLIMKDWDDDAVGKASFSPPLR